MTQKKGGWPSEDSETCRLVQAGPPADEREHGLAGGQVYRLGEFGAPSTNGQNDVRKGATCTAETVHLAHERSKSKEKGKRKRASGQRWLTNALHMVRRSGHAMHCTQRPSDSKPLPFRDFSSLRTGTCICAWTPVILTSVCCSDGSGSKTRLQPYAPQHASASRMPTHGTAAAAQPFRPGEKKFCPQG
ncbi:hypothetical protein BS50DRAFT_172546 [Corynespora cassiicola Philippines]|uniref:Uncharacterized protein n=1 Tax=Corynespora cassiicola Philippines TaxID=1448308 RepID=A0A2T2P5E2_CORCC|nr:hypothetical protein BS50DRAFT_172546 [Corynespora cassiicola Philippines]